MKWYFKRYMKIIFLNLVFVYENILVFDGLCQTISNFPQPCYWNIKNIKHKERNRTIPSTSDFKVLLRYMSGFWLFTSRHSPGDWFVFALYTGRRGFSRYLGIGTISIIRCDDKSFESKLWSGFNSFRIVNFRKNNYLK